MKKILISILLFSTCLGCQKSTPVAQTSASPSPEGSSSEGIGSSSGSMMLEGQQQADVQFPKSEYYPGDEIPLTIMAIGLSDKCWVGVVPSAIEHGSESINDQNDISYIHPHNLERPFLIAPREPGSYDIRLNSDDNDGKELASRGFTVVADPSPILEPKISLVSETKIKMGQKVEISFEAPLSYKKNAWLGWVPSSIPHGQESENDKNNKGYEHLDGRCRGTVVLTAPKTAGEFDLRLNDSDSSGKEVAFLKLTIEPE